MVINLLFVLTILAGVLAIVDGVSRLRGRRGGSIVGIAEIVFAVLMLLSLFVAFPAPLTFLTWCILLEIALVVALFVSGGRRAAWAVTILALLLNSVVLLRTLGWLTIPGVI